MGNGGIQGTTGISGSDSSGDNSSSFEALLNQMVTNSQNQTSKSAGTSVPGTDSKDNIVNGLDSLSLQSQKAQQLQQMVMQQMMQAMTTQGSSSSGTIGSDDSSDESIFPTTNSNNDLSQLIQAIVQGQANNTATTSNLNNSSQVNAILSKGIL